MVYKQNVYWACEITFHSSLIEHLEIEDMFLMQHFLLLIKMKNRGKGKEHLVPFLYVRNEILYFAVQSQLSNLGINCKGQHRNKWYPILIFHLVD